MFESQYPIYILSDGRHLYFLWALLEILWYLGHQKECTCDSLPYKRHLANRMEKCQYVPEFSFSTPPAVNVHKKQLTVRGLVSSFKLRPSPQSHKSKSTLCPPFPQVQVLSRKLWVKQYYTGHFLLTAWRVWFTLHIKQYICNTGNIATDETAVSLLHNIHMISRQFVKQVINVMIVIITLRLTELS